MKSGGFTPQSVIFGVSNEDSGVRLGDQFVRADMFSAPL